MFCVFFWISHPKCALVNYIPKGILHLLLSITNNIEIRDHDFDYIKILIMLANEEPIFFFKLVLPSSWHIQLHSTQIHMQIQTYRLESEEKTNIIKIGEEFWKVLEGEPLLLDGMNPAVARFGFDKEEISRPNSHHIFFLSMEEYLSH